MKFSVYFTVCYILAASALNAEEGFRSLFNGKDLTNWDGNPALWSVKDGVIIGKTQKQEDLQYNQFLIWRGGVVKNFELKAKIKVTGNNTGIQYRSKELPENGKWSVGGYQCDIHPNQPYMAMVYEERGRGIMVNNGQSVIVDDKGGKWLAAQHEQVAADTAQWCEYNIIAQGNHLIHKVDGKMTIDLVDHEEAKRSLEGLIAFQIHKGPAMQVEIKDVMLKELPEGGGVSLTTSPIPSDAQRIEKPGAKAKAKAKEKGKPAEKQASVGPAIGENKATPVGRIKAPKGFQVELLYSVPGVEQGSWVNLCTDDKGRIYTSDQYGGLYRFTPPAADQALQEKDIEKLPTEIRAVNGMVFAFGALYVGVNDYEQKMQSGLYRITDSNADDVPDKVELLRGFDSKSDHGVHAVVPSPDGKSLFLITGNNAIKTETVTSSPVPPLWGDDHLLPRMPDGRGHNRHVKAPGGIIYKLDPDGKNFEVYASGFRNIFDASFNHDGELFTYDADMEYDFNTPWYRPTRINHVVSGAEFGWRNGAGKYPEFYADNLPAVLNIGPGSPCGTTFGYGAKFPAKYQDAMYILDWSWGKLYAVHLTAKGASYIGKKEEFITGSPLPLTDAIISQKDGAMYFTIGGRRVQSGLYRVTYTGAEDTSPIVKAAIVSPERELRHSLEAFHGKQDPQAIAVAWPHLQSTDRFIRWAARTAIEHQPVAEWKDKALSETQLTAHLEALLALARVAGKCPTHRPQDAVIDTATRDQILQALIKIDFKALAQEQRLAHVRIAQITLHRFGNPATDLLSALTAQLDAAFPAENFELNWLLCETLSYLQAPNTAVKGMALIQSAESQEPQMEYARSLRMLKAGWTPELRQQQIEWFLKAANYRGGASFTKFLEFIRNDSIATYTEAEKAEHATLLAKQPEVKSAIENVGAIFAGRTPTMWTLDELSKAAASGMTKRSFENGRKMFSAAACYTCHRFGNAGGMTGPDLTGAGGRYSPHDLLDQIINPSKEINEQFAPVIITKNDGNVLSGVIVNLNGDKVTINTDPSDPAKLVGVDRKEVKNMEVSKVSLMPPMLLAMLKKEEVLDLLAYVLSGGDKDHGMFVQ
jgi:putative heme-binding domain-containing protein